MMRTLDAWTKWETMLLAASMAPKTMSEYRRWVQRHAARWPSVSAESIAAQVDIASASLRRQLYSPTTIKQYQCVLSRFAQDVLSMDADAARAMVRAKAVRPAFGCPSSDEVAAFLRALPGAYRLMGLLMYECGLRISEVLSLSLGDIQADAREIVVRLSKGAKGRRVPVPPELIEALRAQFTLAREGALMDLTRGIVVLPTNDYEARKYPAGCTDLALFPLFRQDSVVFDGNSAPRGRVSIHPSRVERVFAEARRRSGVVTKITPHRLRDAYAVHSLTAGVPVVVIQARLGHASLETTAKYLSYLVSEDGLAAFPGFSLFRRQRGA